MSILALTPGDPAGIGPDITVGYAQQPRSDHVVAFCCPDVLRERAEVLGVPLRLNIYDPARGFPLLGAGELSYIPIPTRDSVVAGRPNPANAAYVLTCLDRAFEACASGGMDAMITGPISKQIINEGLLADADQENSIDEIFTGHTEYLRDLAGTDHVVMMLAIERVEVFGCPLRVALVTTHLPLAKVSEAITTQRISRCVNVLNHDLKTKFGITKPRILVCGLNPHAGEGGLLGAEEEQVINPCLTELKAAGIDVSLAMPADTVFTEPHIVGADAIVAMYHDQGLAPLKSHGFGTAVNITLGLPVIRTSVDHGTAFDIAATGKANHQSLGEAIAVAAKLANRSVSPRD